MITGLTITGDGRFTGLNQVRRFTATAQMLDGPPQDVTAQATWSSSDPEVVSVSGNGEITSVGVGLAAITAQYVHEGSLDVVVASSDRSQMDGLYRLAFTAAPDCPDLPDWARHREYDATIVQPDAESEGSAPLVLTVQLQPGVAPQFTGQVRGSSIGFWFATEDPYTYYYYYAGGPVFSHWIDAARRFTVEGEARGTKRDSRLISGTLSGKIRAVDPATNAAIAECGRVQFSLQR